MQTSSFNYKHLNSCTFKQTRRLVLGSLWAKLLLNKFWSFVRRDGRLEEKQGTHKGTVPTKHCFVLQFHKSQRKLKGVTWLSHKTSLHFRWLRPQNPILHAGYIPHTQVFTTGVVLNKTSTVHRFMLPVDVIYIHGGGWTCVLFEQQEKVWGTAFTKEGYNLPLQQRDTFGVTTVISNFHCSLHSETSTSLHSWKKWEPF